VGGLDAGYDVQATTSAADVIGNDLDHEYPLREIIQKIKKNEQTERRDRREIFTALQPRAYPHMQQTARVSYRFNLFMDFELR
jgi:hypothetical protein